RSRIHAQAHSHSSRRALENHTSQRAHARQRALQHTAIAAHNHSLTLVPDAEDKHASKYLATLTKSERALYHCGKDAVVHRSDWKRRRQEVIEESHISRMTKRQK
ncbi:MAG: hypothetical protein ACPIOQ_29405, partial [Promethearchaeia archaeon]